MENNVYVVAYEIYMKLPVRKTMKNKIMLPVDNAEHDLSNSCCLAFDAKVSYVINRICGKILSYNFNNFKQQYKIKSNYDSYI